MRFSQKCTHNTTTLKTLVKYDVDNYKIDFNDLIDKPMTH